ncbi:hypothetical protein [Herbiconiux daphne]|uniref:Uncharacterized protein n=1 Tax=Herbiconiux daphne TaxID=2970914 RepID=A0ABT2GW07_9MICO|nr:hypothetical protein [Herbiconiux daphne]MCS5732141.1 hypothetical protein [Herbiconiux daphne]
MSDLNDRINEPDETLEFSLSDQELESVDLDTTEDIDDDPDLVDADVEKVDPIFDDDEEVLNDNFGYEE